MEDLEKRIQEIEKRNKRVEFDKKWETSFPRVFSISVITYLIAIVILFIIKNNNPFLNALVPVCGFILSTFSLSSLKSYWITKQN